MDRDHLDLMLKAFSTNGYLVISKSFIDIFGGPKSMYLSNLIDKYIYFQERGMLTKDDGFFLRYKDQTKHIGMNEYELRKHKKDFINDGLIRTEKRGIPAKEFYFINFEILFEKVRRSRPLKFKGLEDDNLKDYKNTKYKNTKYKKSSSPEIGGRQRRTINRNNDRRISPSQFEEFWKIYPKKVSKGASKTAWEKLCRKKDKPKFREIISSIKKQSKSEQWQNIKFIPHASTWLNQQRWLDDPEQMIDYNKSDSIQNSILSDPILKKIIKEYPHLNNGKLLTLSGYISDLKKWTKAITSTAEDHGEYAEGDLALLAYEISHFPSFIENYIDWLNEQSWLNNIGVNCFNMNGPIFKSYKKHLTHVLGLNRIDFEYIEF